MGQPTCSFRFSLLPNFLPKGHAAPESDITGSLNLLSTAVASGQAALNGWRQPPQAGVLVGWGGGRTHHPRAPPPSCGRGFAYPLASLARWEAPERWTRPLQAVLPLQKWGVGGGTFQHKAPGPPSYQGRPPGVIRRGCYEETVREGSPRLLPDSSGLPGGIQACSESHFCCMTLGEKQPPASSSSSVKWGQAPSRASGERPQSPCGGCPLWPPHSASSVLALPRHPGELAVFPS